MKSFLNLIYFTSLLCAGCLCRAQSVNSGVPSPTPYTAVSRDADSCIWQRTEYQQGPNGEIIAQGHQYTELATGLNFKDPNGQWVPAKEEIDILPDGSAAATNGQHQVYFPGDIYDGVIKLVTPDGILLQSQPIGLSYDDGTKTVLIAELTNSIGQLVGANQAIYTNAFFGVNADLLYTYTKAGFEQDVILNEQPPPPEDYGLNPQTTRLQLITEFFDPPQPEVTTAPLPEQAGLVLSDDTLNFGAMKMVRGRTFLLGAIAAEPQVLVGKQWLALNGRQFLVEELPVAAIGDQLSQLPKSQSLSITAKSPLNVASVTRLLPPRHLVKTINTHSMHLAKIGIPTRGLLLDYQTFNGGITTNYIFRGDMTYYISGSFNLRGTNTFEGGTVLKYATNTEIEVSIGVLNWPGSLYQPVIFTAKDDNSVGQTISGSTGNPTNYYANPALFIDNGAAGISDFRISYAQCGIVDAMEPAFGLTNGQIINCAFGVAADGQDYLTLNLGNMLFANVHTDLDLLGVSEPGINAQNTTFAFSQYLFSQNFAGSTGPKFATFVNCIMAGVTNSGISGAKQSFYFGGENNGFYQSFSGQGGVPFGSIPKTTTVYPFQSVGAGSYYLTNGCVFHNAGTNTIVPSLMSNIVLRTTYAPALYFATNISSALTLGPYVQRDTNSSPDMGYHYDPLDYAFGGCNVSNSLTFTAGTAVGWFETNGGVLSSPYAISLGDGANLSFSGNVTQPCYFSRYATVQEGGNNIWTNNGLGGIIINGSGQSPVPVLSGFFTKWTVDDVVNALSGNSSFGSAGFIDSEFYDAGLAWYASSINFSNCLFYRDLTDFYDQYTNTTFIFQDCTFYNGGLAMARSSAYPHSSWTVENTSFDGTDFYTNDYWNGSSTYTTFNYNAYNTNNLNWTNYANLNPPTNGTLEVVGPNDTNVDNYNWQSSWFGNFYLPPNSPLLYKGSTNANLLGLYHFTTQTNQTIEGTNIVDIGYHYVATDPYGNPLDSNGDGIPDYLEDPAGNGSGNWDTTLLFNVIISQPPNGSTLP